MPLLGCCCGICALGIWPLASEICFALDCCGLLAFAAALPEDVVSCCRGRMGTPPPTEFTMGTVAPCGCGCGGGGRGFVVVTVVADGRRSSCCCWGLGAVTGGRALFVLGEPVLITRGCVSGVWSWMATVL